MSKLCRNLFLLFGFAAIVVMCFTMKVEKEVLLSSLRNAGFYLPGVLGVWVIVYAFNARAFQLIVNTGSHERHLSYRHAYKLTVSGFAFSYTTPFGFGGGPYRVMELSSYIGVPHAMSSVVLYSMMHILSHICLWFFSAVLFAVLYFDLMSPLLWVIFGLFAAVVLGVFILFRFFYTRGVLVRLFKPLLRIPLLRRPAARFFEKHADSMQEVDDNIAYIHSRPRVFKYSLLHEFLARVVNAMEYYLILLSLNVSLTYVDAILVLAFSSLIGNLLFFLPMQLGAREGGLSLAVRFLGLSAPGIGVFTGIYTRIRELFWIFIGVTLVKVGNRRLMR